MNLKLFRISKYYLVFILILLMLAGITSATVIFDRRKSNNSERDKSSQENLPTHTPTPTEIPEPFVEYIDEALQIKFTYPTEFKIDKRNEGIGVKLLSISDDKGNLLNIRSVYSDTETFRGYSALDNSTEIIRVYNGSLVAKVKNEANTVQSYTTFYDIKSSEYRGSAVKGKLGIFTSYFPLETENLDGWKWYIDLSLLDGIQDTSEFDSIVKSIQYVSDFNTAIPTGWKSYTDSASGFGFSYPENWELDIPCGKVPNPHPMCDGPQDFANVTAPGNNGSFVIRGGYEGGDYVCNQDFKDINNKYWKDLKERLTYIDGVPTRYFDGKSYDFNPSGKEGDLESKQHLLVRSGSVCYEIYTSNANDPEVGKITETILKSLKFSNRNVGNYQDKYQINVPKTTWVENVEANGSTGAYVYPLCSHMYFKTGYITIQSPRIIDYKDIQCLTNTDSLVSKEIEVLVGSKKYTGRNYSVERSEDHSPYELNTVILENGLVIEFGSIKNYPNVEGYKNIEPEILKVLASYKITK